MLAEQDLPRRRRGPAKMLEPTRNMSSQIRKAVEILEAKIKESAPEPKQPAIIVDAAKFKRNLTKWKKREQNPSPRCTKEPSIRSAESISTIVASEPTENHSCDGTYGNLDTACDIAPLTTSDQLETSDLITDEVCSPDKLSKEEKDSNVNEETHQSVDVDEGKEDSNNNEIDSMSEELRHEELVTSDDAEHGIFSTNAEHRHESNDFKEKTEEECDLETVDLSEATSTISRNDNNVEKESFIEQYELQLVALESCEYLPQKRSKSPKLIDVIPNQTEPPAKFPIIENFDAFGHFYCDIRQPTNIDDTRRYLKQLKKADKKANARRKKEEMRTSKQDRAQAARFSDRVGTRISNILGKFKRLLKASRGVTVQTKNDKNDSLVIQPNQLANQPSLQIHEQNYNDDSSLGDSVSYISYVVDEDKDDYILGDMLHCTNLVRATSETNLSTLEKSNIKRLSYDSGISVTNEARSIMGNQKAKSHTLSNADIKLFVSDAFEYNNRNIPVHQNNCERRAVITSATL
ncbi:hypothetical protein MP638_001894 [Amoeboaphelidium occidentale]|nr:hypothetical protein MP638_001894 [Amoeboaphelidium occidentale]